MSPHRFFIRLSVLAGALGLALAVRAQPLPPHIGYAYPAGGRQGTTFTMSVGGQNLKDAFDAVIAGDGVTARVTGYQRPMTPKELNALREQLQALVKRHAAAVGKPVPERFARKAAAKNGRPNSAVEDGAGVGPPAGEANSNSPRPEWTPQDQQALVKLREQLARGTRPRNPAIAETVVLEVTVAADASVGPRDLRLRTPLGVSNPLRIEVGQLLEFTKPVVTATNGPAPDAARPARLRMPSPAPAPQVSLPVTINGQILPGGVDRYRFAARRGQQLTIVVRARALMPYLADAVPGWFQPTVLLYDARGREVGYADSYRFDPDPVLSYRVPADGDYTLQIRDTIYRGREDFVYRIAVGELPFVTSIFPLGGRCGEPATTFKLAGWNLATDQITVDTKDRRPGVFFLSVRNQNELSNAVGFSLDALPSCAEAEPNDAVANAQSVTLPVVVDGHIGRPGDQDVYRFAGKAGDAVVAEVYARRLGSPLDSLLIVTDAGGHPVAANDDFVDPGAGLITHQADSRVTLKLPASGEYYVHLRDVEQRGGPEYGYRLRISAPEPDFELRVVPSALNLRPGGSEPVTVYALRRDGFEGPIALKFDDAPYGFVARGARIPAGQDKAQFTVTAPRLGANALAALTLVGTATVNGRAVTHAAVPAEDMMQAFAYTHLVPAQEFLVDVVGRFGARTTVSPAGTLQLPVGGTASVTLTVALPRALKLTAPELMGAPAGVLIKATSISGDRAILTLACDPAKVKPGLAGNLIFNTFAARGGKTAKGKTPPRIPLGCAPAIPFEITAASQTE